MGLFKPAGAVGDAVPGCDGSVPFGPGGAGEFGPVPVDPGPVPLGESGPFGPVAP